MVKVSMPLDLPDVEALQVSQHGKQIVIRVESTLKTTVCKHCGRDISQFAGYGEPVTVRHLPSFGQEVLIQYRPKRYECPYCDGHPKTTQSVAWHKAKSPYTRAYEDHILKALINSTVEDVSQKEGLGYGAVRGILQRGVASEVDWALYRRLDVLGIDEIALKKGHRDFVVIVSARLHDGSVDILAILPDRQVGTVEAFLKTIPERLQATIHSVCVDMYENYRQAVQSALPQAALVVDRFHVAQQYREAADRVRKDEMHRLKKELSKAEYATLKPCRHAFWKNRGELTPDEQTALERLLKYAPALRLVYVFREGLRLIFERRLSKEAAQAELRSWMFLVREQKLTCFEPFLNTLTNFFEEISNFFAHRLTSGFVEGLNNKIKVLKRRAFGVYNLQHMFQRLFLDLNGYRLFA